MTVDTPPKLQSKLPIPENLKDTVSITSVDDLINFVYNWGRSYSTWPMLFGLACCAIEMIATASSRYDLERFGWGLMRASPRQADLMIVSGTVTKKMVPNIVRLYNQMPEPKYVLSMGACASGGGPFKEGYNVVSGIDRYVPVDVYVPGCPPTPTALLQGIVALQEKMKKQSFRDVRWYDKEITDETIPIPILGPDIFDPRDIPLIQAEREKNMANGGSAEAVATDKPKKPVKRKVRPPKMPSWDTEPTEEAQALADKINAALGVDAAVPEAGDLIVAPDHLLAFAKHVRDDAELDYKYLSNVTGVDYLDRDPRFEVVYHAYSIKKGGGPLVFKARPTDNTNPELPSLIDIWASADLQEREIYDLYGIKFNGHPRLKRILMWEGFEGYPMRKDYEEPYYAEPVKPFTTRWPDGNHERIEFANPYNKNVVYPADFDPETWVSAAELLEEVEPGQISGTLQTEHIKVNMGPQHPSTHGVFRMVVTLEGELIADLEPVLGYLHRNHEKIGERNGWLMNMPYTDRLDYITSMINNHGYALLVEKMAGIEVPERAEYIRIIMSELTRVVSHLWLIGFFLNDLGAFFTPALYAIKAREMVLDLFEEVAGARMMCNYLRFGGVFQDVSDDWLNRAAYLAREKLPAALDELETLLNENEILLARTKGVGYLSPEDLISNGITGPQLRAAGVNYDIRKVEPYGIYDRFNFDIPLLHNSDVYDRYLIRILEARQSLRILDQALAQIPKGEIMSGRSSYTQRVPAGDGYSRVEAPKGELGYYAVSNGSGNPWRYRVRSPSYVNLTALPTMTIGEKIADAIIILGAIDIVLGEVDR